jgi:hypothetical protein
MISKEKAQAPGQRARKAIAHVAGYGPGLIGFQWISGASSTGRGIESGGNSSVLAEFDIDACGDARRLKSP